MTTLVLGATGATGQLAVKQLLKAGEPVKVIVRSASRLGNIIPAAPELTVIEGDITEFTDQQWLEAVKDVSAVVSCLGHTMTAKGLFGHPRRLVKDTVVRVHEACKAIDPAQRIKYVLMNTSGAKNPDLNEKHSVGEATIIGMLRVFLPPHADNEEAAAYLRTQVGHSDPHMSWVIVRPDNLIDSPQVSTYCEEPSPVRSPIFDSGQTSRINVGHFMSRLVIDEKTWQQWQGQTPVLYDTLELS